jgi:hypothetical protein
LVELARLVTRLSSERRSENLQNVRVNTPHM